MTDLDNMRRAVRSLLSILEDADVTFNSTWEPHRAEDVYHDAVRECRALSHPWMDAKDWKEVEANIARAAG